MSTLRFTDGAYNLAAGTRDAFGQLSDALVAGGHPAMVVIDGDREPDDEERVFLERFRPQSSGNGPHGDVRWWNGVRYVRFSPAGTVAVPGSGNHGKRRANDLAWPYNSNTAAHRRAQQLGKNFDITCEGMSFSEWWHWTFWGALGAIGAPAGGGSTDFAVPSIQEDDMATLITGGGQNLVVGGVLIPLNSTAEVQAVKGAQVLEVAPSTHYNIIQALQRASNGALPVIVYVRDGNGTVYLLDNGDLRALVDPTTLATLHAQNAASITLSQAEVDNLLRAS